ncbi:hypothetical protein HanIR_Chr10g0457621 [Helianthus annuus]|nr:hypothetical protein HanIR_Chr10g0457621 [Helianthus annuus]
MITNFGEQFHQRSAKEITLPPSPPNLHCVTVGVTVVSMVVAVTIAVVYRCRGGRADGTWRSPLAGRSDGVGGWLRRWLWWWFELPLRWMAN